MFYTTIIGLPIILTGIKEFLHSRRINYIIIPILALVLCVRTNVGYDLKTYHDMFEVYQSGAGVNHVFSFAGGLELGYALLNVIIARIGLSFKAVLFSVAAFNFYVMFIFLDKLNVRHKTYAVFVYVMIFDIYVYSLSAIRQSIAISFYLLSVIFMINKKNVKAFALLLAGALFHWSIVIMIPFLFFMDMKKNIRLGTLIAIAISSPFAYLYLMNSVMVDFLSGYRYNMEFYLKILSYERTTSYVKCFIFIIISIIAILFLAIFRETDCTRMIKINRVQLSTKIHFDILEWSTILFLITKSWLAINYLSALPRLQMYFYFLLPFEMAKILEKVRGINKILMIVLSCIVLIFHFRMTLAENVRYFGNGSFCFDFY